MDNSQDITLKAEVAALRGQLADALNRLSRSEGAIEQLGRSIAAGTRMTIWQFIGFVAVMAGTLFGTLYWATGVLEKRLEQNDRRIEQMERNFNARFEQLEKNMNARFADTNARFDDLKQVVLSKRRFLPLFNSVQAAIHHAALAR